MPYGMFIGSGHLLNWRLATMVFLFLAFVFSYFWWGSFEPCHICSTIVSKEEVSSKAEGFCTTGEDFGFYRIHIERSTGFGPWRVGYLKKPLVRLDTDACIYHSRLPYRSSNGGCVQRTIGIGMHACVLCQRSFHLLMRPVWLGYELEPFL